MKNKPELDAELSEISGTERTIRGTAEFESS